MWRKQAGAATSRRGRRIAIVTTLRVPKTGGIPTTKVIVVKWLKRKGQKVRQGEPVVELQTDKVNYELDSPAEGVLLEIVAPVDSEVPVGDVLCHIGQPDEAVPKS
jgi:pyruvate dehydrogenase E2 component (dihydrolipoamide acetyltransferase)